MAPDGPLGRRVAADPIGCTLAGRAVGVAVGSITAAPIVAGNKSVAVGRGVRVGVAVRVGPKSGNGRTVDVGTGGRGVAVGAAQAANTLTRKLTLRTRRKDVAGNRRVNILKLYRRWRLL